jgi:hypothetical protein
MLVEIRDVDGTGKRDRNLTICESRGSNVPVMRRLDERTSSVQTFIIQGGINVQLWMLSSKLERTIIPR